MVEYFSRFAHFFHRNHFSNIHVKLLLCVDQCDQMAKHKKIAKVGSLTSPMRNEDFKNCQRL